MTETLPPKYMRMTPSQLNVLALGGDEHARQALAVHSLFDSLIEQVESLTLRVNAAIDRQAS